MSEDRLVRRAMPPSSADSPSHDECAECNANGNERRGGKLPRKCLVLARWQHRVFGKTAIDHTAAPAERGLKHVCEVHRAPRGGLCDLFAATESVRHNQ